jgi:aminoglycoside phosphotransferase (APT) family kinase protein
LRDRPATLDAFFEEGRIRDMLAAAWPLPPRNAPVLLHGDYWPGNIFWRAGRLVVVLDWEDAAVGDPLADLANSRLEILWAFGPDAMTQFTEHYCSLTALDFTDLPYWDLCLALRPMGKFTEWAADATAAATMRDRLRWFITQAFERMAFNPDKQS